ncbi:MAG: transporter [Arcobacter sp.]|nr:MAG: transporter [Arcobacter sp.]
MNYIKAVISKIDTVDNLNVVSFKAGSVSLKMMSLELDESLKIGTKVVLAAKSTNISLLKGSGEGLSISNQLPCAIKSLDLGELLCRVRLRFLDMELESLITKDSALRMKLEVGEAVFALIKSSELSIIEVL